jgi:hypothetical protein
MEIIFLNVHQDFNISLNIDIKSMKILFKISISLSEHIEKKNTYLDCNPINTITNNEENRALHQNIKSRILNN